MRSAHAGRRRSPPHSAAQRPPPSSASARAASASAAAFNDFGELRRALQLHHARLVHVKGAVDLDLHGVAAGGGRAVMLGDVAAGVGLVAADAIAAREQRQFERLDRPRRGAGAEPVAEHDVERSRLGERRRHRMAVDQDRHAESRARALDQSGQPLVIGTMQGGDARQRVGDRHRARDRSAGRRRRRAESSPSPAATRSERVLA